MANANFTCDLEAWRSGTTLYGRMHYYRTDGQTYTYSDSCFPDPTMNLAGTTFTDTDFGNRVRAGISVGNIYSTTYSRTVAGSGDRTVTFTAGSCQRSDFAGSWSKTVYFPSQVVPPSGGYINNITSYWDDPYNEIRVHTTSAGVADDGGGTLSSLNWLLSESTYVTGIPRCSTNLSSNGAASTLSNSLNTYSGATIDVAPNKLLYVGLYAANSAGDYRYNGGTIITAPPKATISVLSKDDRNIVVSYNTGNQSGASTMYLSYTIDGGTTWKMVETITTSGSKSGTFIVSGLSPNTSYTISAKLESSHGLTASNTISGSTNKSYTVVRPTIYGSVSSLTDRVCALYGPVGGNSMTIDKFYGSVNDKSKVIYQGFGHLDYT